MNQILHYEVRDHIGNVLTRYSDPWIARGFAAGVSRDLAQGYTTVWWVNDWGCPNDLIGHAAHGTFNLRPCLGAR